jgi:carbon-monoxide dehydrogenase medium subunit
MSFDYVEATSIVDAVALISQSPGAAKFVAGGTDLVIQIRRHRQCPQRLIGIQSIEALKTISIVDGCVVLGALVTHKQIERDARFSGRLFGLAESARVIGGHQVRNAGTIGGNICNASPAADLIPILLALEAEVELVRPDASRWLRLDMLLTGPGKTTKAPDEMLTRVRFAEPGARTATAFLKAGRRRAMEISVISIACSLALDDQERCTDIRLSVGAAAPVPFRAGEAERFLVGERLTEERLRKAAALAAAAASPITDVRASAGHRRRLIAALVPRTLRACLTRIEGDQCPCP